MVGKYGGKVAVSTVGLSSESMSTFTGIFVNVGAKKFNQAEEYATLGVILGSAISFLISFMLFTFSKNRRGNPTSIYL